VADSKPLVFSRRDSTEPENPHTKVVELSDRIWSTDHPSLSPKGSSPETGEAADHDSAEEDRYLLAGWSTSLRQAILSGRSSTLLIPATFRTTGARVTSRPGVFLRSTIDQREMRRISAAMRLKASLIAPGVGAKIYMPVCCAGL
jgi:hypothetical protein